MALRSPSARAGTASRTSSTTPKAGGASSSTKAKSGGGATKGKTKKDDGKTADDAATPKVDTQAELLKKLYAEQREAERVKALADDVEGLQRKVRELTTDRDNNLSRIRELIVHYDSKLNERDALLTRAQQTIQELTDTVTKQRHDAARLAVARDNELARRVADEQMEARVWRDKFEKLYNDEKHKRMEGLERDKKRLEAELEKAVKAHALHATELEHKIHIEKTKIRYSMIRKIKETKNALLAKTKDQLHTTTKRVIMENEQMTTELQYQSKETERTMALNDRLRAENRALKRDVALAAQESQMLANRTFFLKKLIAKLTEKLKVAERNANAAANPMGNGARNLPKPGGGDGSGIGDLTGGLDAKDQHIHELETQLEELQEEVATVKAAAATSVDTTRAATEQLLALQDEGTAFVLACLDDLKREQQAQQQQQAPAAANKGEDVKSVDGAPAADVFRLPVSTRDSTPAERRRILDALLGKLRLQATALPTPNATGAGGGSGGRARAVGSGGAAAAALRSNAAAATSAATAAGAGDDGELDAETAAALADPDVDHDAVAAALAADDDGAGGGDLPRPNAGDDSSSPTLPPVRGAARHVPTDDDPGFAI